MISKDTTFVIVGLGLLGGSYAKGLKEAGYRVYGIAGVGRRSTMRSITG